MTQVREEICSVALFLFLEARAKGVSSKDLIEILRSLPSTDIPENSSQPESV